MAEKPTPDFERLRAELAEKERQAELAGGRERIESSTPKASSPPGSASKSSSTPGRSSSSTSSRRTAAPTSAWRTRSSPATAS